MSGDMFGHHNLRRGVLLASSGYRPGGMLNIQVYTAASMTKGYPSQSVNRAKVE